jgi:hypothetical protein
MVVQIDASRLTSIRHFSDAHVRDSNPIYARSVVNALKNADMVLLSGGGFFSDHFASHAASLLEALALAQAKSIPTAIITPASLRYLAAGRL